MTPHRPPRVLLISQWPNLKNAEYELIERIRRTGYPVAVVDYLGFDVATGECINDAQLADRFDFAVSFHYDTPKFLNLPTFLWVANPLEFMHAQGGYRTHLIHHLRSYDDYLYNGSQRLKGHIRSVVGARWRDSGLAFIGSCSRNALIAPQAERASPESDKLFYCGVNWEAISDKAGRAQGLLEILQARGAADFYGPEKLLGVRTWEKFSSYRGEIPFDGASIFREMHRYAAVLAVSSPAHLKSQTSSGRAVEGFAAGVPVISDENPHVRAQFGDLPFYFTGDTEAQRADAVLALVERIRVHPAEALERVREAQAMLARDYCFEPCLERIQQAVLSGTYGALLPPGPQQPAGRASVEAFVFAHDPYAPAGAAAQGFPNLPYVMFAAERAGGGAGVRVRVVCTEGVDLPQGAERLPLDAVAASAAEWDGLRLGEKVRRLAARLEGTHAVFFTPSDLPHHDHFAKMGEWLARGGPPAEAGAFVSGFFVNDLKESAPHSAMGIVRNSASSGLFRWSQNSIAEHQLGQLCFRRAALEAMDLSRMDGFDVVLPVALLMECMAKAIAVERSRYVTLRVRHGYYHRYLDAFTRVAQKGYWAQQYELLSNSSHELNALYDEFHECPQAVAIADRIIGHDLPPAAAVDPAVQSVNAFIDALRPYYRAWLRLKHRLTPSSRGPARRAA